MQKLLKATFASPEAVPAELAKRVAGLLAECPGLQVDKEALLIGRRDKLAGEEAISAKLKELDARAIYAAPFAFDVTLEDIAAVFSRLVPVAAVHMRRSRKGVFKGSVFVELHSEEAAAKVLGSSLEYEGAPLRLEAKGAYCARKAQEKAARLRAGEDPGYASESSVQEEQRAFRPNAMETPEFQPGQLVRVKFSQTPLPEGLTWFLIKEALGGPEQGVSRVELYKDKGEAVVVFTTAGQAKAAVDRQTGTGGDTAPAAEETDATKSTAKADAATETAEKVEPAGSEPGAEAAAGDKPAENGAGGGALIGGVPAQLEVLQGEEELHMQKYIQWKREQFSRRTGGGRHGGRAKRARR